MPIAPLYGADGARPGCRRGTDRPAGRAAVHPRHPPDRLPHPAVDDADVRRASGRPRTPTRGSTSCWPPARPACRSPTTCRRCTATTPTTPRRRASSGRAASPSAAWPTWRSCSTGLPLDRVSTSMTINSPAAPIWAMYIVAAEKAGVPRDRLEGTTQNDILKEFIAQKEFLFPPEPSMRLVTDTIEFGTRETAALEHDLDQRLPHPRGGLDRGPGAGLHHRRRDGLRRGGPRARPARRRLRAAAVVLLQQPQRLLRGDRQVPGQPRGSGTT